MTAPRVILTLLGALVTLVVVGPLVVPIQRPAGTVPAKDLADVDSRFLDVEVSGVALQVHYKVQGWDGSTTGTTEARSETGSARPTIVLLHGFGASLFSWHAVLAELGQLGRVVAYDRPGFGLTSRPLALERPGRSPYSFEAQAELVIALLDGLGVDRAILVGNSAGGTVALHTALLHPERVEALVLVDAAIYASGGGPAWIRPLYSTPQLRRVGPLVVRSLIERQGQRGTELSWHDPSKVTPATLEGYRRPLGADDWDLALWELVRSAEIPVLSDRLGELRMPVLVVTGDDDRVVPTAQSVRLAREIAGSRLIVFPNCGHLPQEECPQEFLEAVRGFITETLAHTAM